MILRLPQTWGTRESAELKRSIVTFSVTLADPLSIRLAHSLPGKHFFTVYIRLALQSASFVDPVFASPALLYLNCLLLTLQYLYYLRKKLITDQ